MSGVRLVPNRVAAVLAQMETTEVGDAGSTRTVLVITAVLVVAAVVLSVITVWYWRSTVPDPEALAPLVEMTEKRRRRRWRLLDRIGR